MLYSANIYIFATKLLYMDLSIIVSVYNVEEYIRPCIESIFLQELNEECFEVIIVNDGTEDRSIEVIQDIIEQHKNVTVLNQKNQGLSLARNNGIAAAKGEYILMPDGDDLLVVDSLKPLLEKAIETEDDMIIADFAKMDDEEILGLNNSPLKQPPFNIYEKTGKDFLLEDMIPIECYVWRILFRRDFLIENNINFYPGIFFQDIPFTHECYLKANKCLKVSTLLNIYRRGHSNAATSPLSFSTKKAKDLCIAIIKTWGLIRSINNSPGTIKKIKSNIYILYTNLCFRILHFLDNREDAIEILEFLNKQAPDLRFSNSISQRIGDYLRRKMPRIYLIFLNIKWSFPSH